MAVFAVRQRSLMYFPPRGYPDTPARTGLPWEDLVLTAEDGVRLAAWWVPAADPAAPALLYLHGNAANLAAFVDLAAACARRGLSFLAVDYRGYGASAGSPTEAGLYRDARAAWRWLAARGAAARTVVYGQSLGTAVGAWLAAHEPVAGLALEAPLPSMRLMARRHYPWLLVPRWLLRDRFETLVHLRGVRCPVLVIQGEADAITPPAFGRMVFETAPARRQYLSVPGAGHNDLRWDDPGFQEVMMAFIRSCVGAADR